MKICCTCGETKPLDEFGNNRKKKDGKQAYCKECGREAQRKHYRIDGKRRAKIEESRAKARRRNLEHIVIFLKSHPCVDCGETDPVVLDFDHVDLSSKKDNVSNLWSCSLAHLIAEMSKCEVRCANCHRRKTARQFGWQKLFFIGDDRCL